MPMADQTQRPARSWGEKVETDERFLDNLPTIATLSGLIAAVVFGIEYLGWMKTILGMIGTIIVILGFVIMRHSDRIGLFLNLAAKEEREEEDRRAFESTPATNMIEVTDQEINEISAIMRFADDTTSGEPLLPPPTIDWSLVVGAIIWPFTIWLSLVMNPADDDTDQAEDWMWWTIFLAIPSFMLYGWFEDGTWVRLWQVILVYLVSGVGLWWILTYQRRTTN